MNQGNPGRDRIGRAVGSLAAIGLLLGAAFTTSVQAQRAGRASRATPTYGGSYSIRLSAAPDCLDPQGTGEAASNLVDGYVLDSLLDIDAKGHYVGDLATKYKISNHGLRITFSLRHGVRFSNGDPFTAAAVKYTFDRALNPATKSPLTAGELAQVSAIKVINKYTVELDLRSPFRPLLTNLA